MKQSFKIIIFFLLSLSACKKETTELPLLEIASEDLLTLQQPFLQGAENREILIKTTLNVTKVTSSENWCKVSIIENDGTFLRVSVSPNEGFEERTAEIVLFGQGTTEIKIPITQWGNEPSLVVAETEDIKIEDGQLEFLLQITSNVDFTMTMPEWIQDQGDNTPIVGSKVYKFIAAAILPGERTGEIQISAEGFEDLNKVIPITQSQQVLNPELTTFSPISGEKGTTVTLHGNHFGSLADIVEVFFDDKKAEIVTMEDTMIKVLVPRTPGENCVITIVIGEDSFVYDNKFDYNKSWSLSTVVGNGNSTFKAGSLDQAQIKARYISIDKNNNIFATHREVAADRHFAKINEAENSLISLSGSTPINAWTPNASSVGPDGTVYVANDGTNGTSYYKLDPRNNWEPVLQTVTYTTAPPASSYLYRLVYNEKDNHLYGVIGNNAGQMIKINPANNTGSIVYEWGSHPSWYAFTINPSNSDMFYTMVNSAGIGYGVHELDLRNMNTDRFKRLNSNGPTAAASATTLNDGPLTNAGFGRAWDMTFGKDGKLYVSDAVNHVIRKIDLQAKTVQTIVGIAGSAGYADGGKEEAKLNDPRGLAWNNDGTVLYISDWGNNRIRKWAFD